MLNLVEHVSDPLTVLQKAASLLAPNGIIVIKTPNTKCRDASLFKNTYWGGAACTAAFGSSSLKKVFAT
ncbi:MAG: methyltransferase domain-containing protein [Bacteroidota bacterium]